MNDDVVTNIICADCKAELPAEWMRQSVPENKCPQCGSIKKIININIAEHLEIHESLKAKGKNVTMPRKKNPRVDIFSGDDLRKSDNRWMKKERVIDKDKNLYKEIVTDPATGKVIHHTEEPLSQHSGHGSAKFKTKP